MILREYVGVELFQVFGDTARFFDRLLKDLDKLLFDVFDRLGFRAKLLQR